MLKKKRLNKTYLVTAGPTHEKIDPVRYIGNYSSGKMGFAIAEQLASRGAKVILIAGPVALTINHPNITRIDVISAAEMYDQCLLYFSNCNGAVMVAAVADFAPVVINSQKIKRTTENFILELKANPDIAASLGAIKRKDQIVVGFALETSSDEEKALAKLRVKNLDLIILNSLNDKDSGFVTDTNSIKILNSEGVIFTSGLKLKTDIAVDIVNKIIETEDFILSLA